MDNFGEKLYPGSRNLLGMTRLQIFSQLFPKEQMSEFYHQPMKRLH
jgi:hypothetical protein